MSNIHDKLMTHLADPKLIGLQTYTILYEFLEEMEFDPVEFPADRDIAAFLLENLNDLAAETEGMISELQTVCRVNQVVIPDISDHGHGNK